MLEAEITGQWRSINYLTVAEPGGTEPQAIAIDSEVSFARVGRTVRPYRLLVPPVEPGGYRVRQDINNPERNLSATLYASLMVVS
ncbi:MAG TPA: hypothetical protein VFZ97_13285 [Acidimicrobiales bacterium]